MQFQYECEEEILRRKIRELVQAIKLAKAAKLNP